MFLAFLYVACRHFEILRIDQSGQSIHIYKRINIGVLHRRLSCRLILLSCLIKLSLCRCKLALSRRKLCGSRAKCSCSGKLSFLHGSVIVLCFSDLTVHLSKHGLRRSDLGIQIGKLRIDLRKPYRYLLFHHGKILPCEILYHRLKLRIIRLHLCHICQSHLHLLIGCLALIGKNRRNTEIRNSHHGTNLRHHFIQLIICRDDLLMISILFCRKRRLAGLKSGHLRLIGRRCCHRFIHQLAVFCQFIIGGILLALQLFLTAGDLTLRCV